MERENRFVVIRDWGRGMEVRSLLGVMQAL
jgi:hypothetical protein